MQDFRGHPHGAGFLSCITNGCKQQLGTTHVYYNAGFFGSRAWACGQLSCAPLSGTAQSSQALPVCVGWVHCPAVDRSSSLGACQLGAVLLAVGLPCDACALPHPLAPSPLLASRPLEDQFAPKPCGCHVVLGVAVAHFVPVSCSIMFWRREVLRGLH